MIRLACQGDAASIAALTSQLGYPTTPDAMQSRLAHALASELDVVMVAAAPGGGVAGWIHVIERHLLESAPFCEIMGLVVDEAQRGRGVGAELVRAGEAWARGRGVSTLRVRSNVVRERAHAFYRANGYTEVKRQGVLDKRLHASLGGERGEPDHAA